EPLALKLLEQGSEEPKVLAQAFITEEVPTIEDALQGAQDILAEQFSDDPAIRALIRKFTYDTGLLVSEATGEEDVAESQEFQMYFDYFEDVAKIPPHRVLAINRGERLKALKVRIQVDVDRINSLLQKELLQEQASP